MKIGVNDGQYKSTITAAEFSIRIACRRLKLVNFTENFYEQSYSVAVAVDDAKRPAR